MHNLSANNKYMMYDNYFRSCRENLFLVKENFYGEFLLSRKLNKADESGYRFAVVAEKIMVASSVIKVYGMTRADRCNFFHLRDYLVSPLTINDKSKMRR